MKKIITKKNCNFENKRYTTGEEIKTNKKTNWNEIWKLNEKGFIEPLTVVEFQDLKNAKKGKESE